jgi:hypothetical protein
MIAGFIVQGTGPRKVLVRARGPSLAQFGVANSLQDPQLQLFSGQTPIGYNNNWQEASNGAEIAATGNAPPHPNEAAVLLTLNPGAYSAILSGLGGTTGVGIVEVYAVP